MKKTSMVLKKYGFNPHLPKVHTRKQLRKLIKKNPEKIITLIINLEKIIKAILKDKMLPILAKKPYKLTKKEIKFKSTEEKKFSKKQLAAQELFAKRAKAGTLRKRRR